MSYLCFSQKNETYSYENEFGNAPKIIKYDRNDFNNFMLLLI